jgi:hypothetical protein
VYGERWVAVEGLGANLADDAVYPPCFKDARGQPFNGSQSYVLHFDRGNTPPVRGFWSVTMYDATGYFVPNALNRYSLHSGDPMHLNPDGSLDIVLQKDAPSGPLHANWLPAPSGHFNLLLRMYWPKQPVLTGRWQPPAVQPRAVVSVR